MRKLQTILSSGWDKCGSAQLSVQRIVKNMSILVKENWPWSAETWQEREEELKIMGMEEMY